MGIEVKTYHYILIKKMTKTQKVFQTSYLRLTELSQFHFCLW